MSTTPRAARLETTDRRMRSAQPRSGAPRQSHLTLAPSSPHARRHGPGGLTRRELEILQLVAAGMTNRAAGRALWVTSETVKFHLSNIYRKLGVGNRAAASQWAIENGLAEPATPAPGLASRAS